MERRPFDKFNDKPQRFSRDGQYSGERPSERGPGRFEGRSSRFERQNERYGYRSGQYEDRRRDRDSGREWGRDEEGSGRGYGDRPRWQGRQDSWKEGRQDRQEFSRRSGPRARAADSRRFSDRNAFARGGTVRLDADVAKYFRTAEEVNAALRQVIALAGLVRKEPVEKAEAASAPAQAPEAFDEVAPAPVPEEEFGEAPEGDIPEPSGPEEGPQQ